jgi:hypothetical protein
MPEEELKMLCGISFGYPDANAPINCMKMHRVAVEDSVTFYN